MKGTVVYLYAFDLANEIRTSQVRELFSQKPFPFQIRVGSTVPRDVEIYRPLTIGLKPEEGTANGARVTVKPFVKIFDVGCISISYEVPFEVPDLAALVPFHALSVDGVALTGRAERLCQQVAENLRPYMVKPSAERPPAEAYTVFCLQDAGPSAQDWAASNQAAIAALLNEEPDPGRLSPSQINETFEHSLSYTRADLAVIDWDAALVLDGDGYYDDVLYVVELANLQLEEYRLMDDRLDRLFARAYEDLERNYDRPRLLRSPGRQVRSLRAIRMDMTKMSEEVSNITKFVGDWYLARVYLACKDRFHLGEWESGVDQKLHELDRLYSLVQGEINDRRMLLLEVLIVALFIVDVLALFFFKK